MIYLLRVVLAFLGLRLIPQFKSRSLLISLSWCTVVAIIAVIIVEGGFNAQARLES